MIGRRRRGRRAESSEELDRTHRALDELEERAGAAVRRVVAEGQRNHFAERLRRTLQGRPDGNHA